MLVIYVVYQNYIWKTSKNIINRRFDLKISF